MKTLASLTLIKASLTKQGLKQENHNSRNRLRS